ncbi:MAG: hypothetical protein COB38_10175 [Gammaproteobacteria bacterium]|nr:MAG: hypothetical protein COB38_10175 [Gammaproteobacteria bacterium]
MNILSSINSYSANKVNPPIDNNPIVPNRKRVAIGEERQFASDKLSRTQNRSTINSFDINKIESSTSKTTTNQTGVNTSSSSKINPNLLDTVFKLKSKNERTEINTNRRSDLYLQTEIIASSKLADLGIGLDLYV